MDIDILYLESVHRNHSHLSGSSIYIRMVLRNVNDVKDAGDQNKFEKQQLHNIIHFFLMRDNVQIIGTQYIKYIGKND